MENQLKYYRSREVNPHELSKEDQLLYMLENEWISFESQLDQELEKLELSLPNNFLFVNNSSGATNWIIYFQDLGYKVEIKELEYESKSFGKNKIEKVIVMLVTKEEK